MRDQFEKLPEVAEILNKNGGGYYKEHTNDYHHCNLYFDKFLNGAWYAYQDQQKIISMQECDATEIEMILNDRDYDDATKLERIKGLLK